MPADRPAPAANAKYDAYLSGGGDPIAAWREMNAVLENPVRAIHAAPGVASPAAKPSTANASDDVRPAPAAIATTDSWKGASQPPTAALGTPQPVAKIAIRKLAVGDIFHAESPNGASLICLALSVTETTIHASTVTTQIRLEFHRETGVAELGEEPILCTIDSTAPLLTEIHNVILGIDTKFRLEQAPERLKLTDARDASIALCGWALFQKSIVMLALVLL